MKKILVIIFLLGIATVVSAQPNPDTLWTHAYGGNNWEVAYSIQQTSDDGYVIAGYTDSFGAGNGDFYVIKSNLLGSTLWTRTFGGSGVNSALSIQQTADGGYVVAGYTSSFGVGGDFYVVKTNGVGDTIWTRTYGGTGLDGALSIQNTFDGGYVVAGYTESFGQGGDFYVVKTNAQGNVVWTRTYGGSGLEAAFSIQQTADSGYVIAGFTNSFGAPYNYFYVVKTNMVGDTIWTRTYDNGSGDDHAYSIQQTSDGGYAIAGSTGNFSNWDFYVVKTDANGDTVWTRTFGGSGSDIGMSIQQTTEGGYVIAGYTDSFGAGNTNLYLVKTNGQGNTLWTRTYGGSFDNSANSVHQTSDGGFVIAGYTDYLSAGTTDFYVVKTGPDPLGVGKGHLSSPSSFMLSAFPNPFNPVTTIAFDLTARSRATVGVYNLNGQLVTTLLDKSVNAGSHSVSFDGGNLSSGLYFVRLTTPEQTAVTKIVLMK